MRRHDAHVVTKVEKGFLTLVYRLLQLDQVIRIYLMSQLSQSGTCRNRAVHQVN